MNVLIACEESQRVCTAFRERGHNAFSCDIQPCSGGHPEWHIQGDVLEVLNPDIQTPYGSQYYGFLFQTMDGFKRKINGSWDLIIAHPPCTYLTTTGNRWFNKEKYGDKAMERLGKREEAIEFFMNFVNAECPRVAIENPVGIMSTRFRKPDQYIEPFMFGDMEKKKTGLWLKGLPLLKPSNIVDPVIVRCKSGANEPRWHMETMHLEKDERSRVRSKTFPGIARAMAEQWG